MTVEINTVEVVVSNEINHVDIIVDVVVNPNVGGGGSHDELRLKNANPNFQHLRIDQINSFLTEIPQDIMNLIYAGL